MLKNLALAFWENVKNRTQFRAKKLRILFAWPSVILLFWCSQSDASSFTAGIPLIILGEAIRIWAGGYQEKKGKLLVTNGPYAYTRNPLYWGNFLIGLGMAVVASNLWLTLIFIAGFILIYASTIKSEEQDLTAHFGDEYRNYAGAVPRIFPRFSPYLGRTKIPFGRRSAEGAGGRDTGPAGGPADRGQSALGPGADEKSMVGPFQVRQRTGEGPDLGSLYH